MTKNINFHKFRVIITMIMMIITTTITMMAIIITTTTSIRQVLNIQGRPTNKLNKPMTITTITMAMTMGTIMTTIIMTIATRSKQRLLATKVE
jgi:hypothetical protein